MAFDASIADPFERIKASLEHYSGWNPDQWDMRITMAAKLVSAKVTGRGTAICNWTFTVEPWMCNGAGNMHGGAVATLFDNITSFTIGAITADNFWETGGVTRTLNCTYLRPAPGGAQMTLTAEVVQSGKKMLTIQGVMRNESGDITALCEHGKVSVTIPKMNL